MQPSEFNLLQNPFAILRIGVRSTRAEAATARDNVVWDHDTDEDLAQQAFSALATPRDRLAGEIGFLLGMTPSAARRAVDALRGNELSLPEEGTPPLAAANLLAHGLSAGPVSEVWALSLVEAYEALDVQGVADELAANCQISGERPPSLQDVDSALSNLALSHGAALARALATPDHAQVAERVVASWPQGDLTGRLGDAFIASYRERISSYLGAYEERIAGFEKSLLDKPSMEAARGLTAALADWDHLRQPVQIWDASHGLDEPDSQELGDRLFRLTVALVKKKKAFTEARLILDALISAFPELPKLSRKLNKASKELDEAAEDAADEEAMGPLLSAVDNIAKQEGLVDRHLGGNVVDSAWPPAVALRTAFVAASARNPTIAVGIVRGLAIRLHNDHDRTVAAAGLTRWLRANAPPGTDAETIEKLAADEHTLLQSLDMQRLNAAAERSDNGEVAQIAKRLAARAKDQQERNKLLAISLAAEDRQNRAKGATKRKWLIWAAIAGFILWLIASEEKSPRYEEAAPAVEAEAPDVSAYPSDTPEIEGVPSISRGSKYSQEYRDCQDLESSIKIEELTVDSANEESVNNFNQKVENFNQQCAGRWR